MQRTFLLGMGAQKAATTWLHHYVMSSERATARPSTDKELNIFNYHRNYIKLTPKKSTPRSLLGRHGRLRTFRKYPSKYFNWLDQNVEEGGLYSDISPEYCVLDADHIKSLEESLHKIGFKLKIVFLMREPVDRCISAFNMHYSQISKNEGNYNLDWNYSRNENFLRYLRSVSCNTYTDYETVYNNIKSSGCLHNSFIDGYRAIFCKGRFQDLNDFLSLKPRDSERKKVVFNGSQEKIPCAYTTDLCRRNYSHIYDFVEKELPHVVKAW